MSQDTSKKELREKIVKEGRVKLAQVVFSQKLYSNNTTSPIEIHSQEIVEIGVDDLVNVIATTVREVLDRLSKKSSHYTEDCLVADGLDEWAVSYGVIQQEREKWL